MQLDDMYRIVGAREWLDEFCGVDMEGRVAFLLGEKGVDGECISDGGCGLGRWWQRRKQLLYG